MGCERKRRDFPADLGAVVRAARERLRLSRGLTALLVGIGPDHLRRIEKGEVCPSVVVARDLADVLLLQPLLREQLLGAAAPDTGRSRPGAKLTGNAVIGRQITTLLLEVLEGRARPYRDDAEAAWQRAAELLDPPEGRPVDD